MKNVKVWVSKWSSYIEYSHLAIRIINRFVPENMVAAVM